MKQFFILIFVFVGFNAPKAQPYIDIVNVKYTNSMDAGLWNRHYSTNRYIYCSGNINIPLVFKKDSSLLIISPACESWAIKGDDFKEFPDRVQSTLLAVSYLKPLSKKYTLIASPVSRFNGQKGIAFRKGFQIGGAVLLTYNRKPGLQYKWGIYYNNEFTGPLLVPLLGIDWRINEKNNLFGVLPSNLIYEHQFKKSIYGGASFKTFTNTYQAGFTSGADNKLLRVDENQLLLFTDIYLHKNWVLNFELGHSVFRKIRLGSANGTDKYYFDDTINDNLIFKTSLVYRIRFR